MGVCVCLCQCVCMWMWRRMRQTGTNASVHLCVSGEGRAQADGLKEREKITVRPLLHVRLSLGGYGYWYRKDGEVKEEIIVCVSHLGICAFACMCH